MTGGKGLHPCCPENTACSWWGSGFTSCQPETLDAPKRSPSIPVARGFYAHCPSSNTSTCPRLQVAAQCWWTECPKGQKDAGGSQEGREKRVEWWHCRAEQPPASSPRGRSKRIWAAQHKEEQQMYCSFTDVHQHWIFKCMSQVLLKMMGAVILLVPGGVLPAYPQTDERNLSYLRETVLPDFQKIVTVRSHHPTFNQTII